MKEPREKPWTYHVKFSVDTAHYETTVQAYGRDTVKELLEKQYPNCTVVVKDIQMEKKEYTVPPAKEDGETKKE